MPWVFNLNLRSPDHQLRFLLSLVGHLSITRRSRQILVAEEDLDDTNVGTVFQ